VHLVDWPHNSSHAQGSERFDPITLDIEDRRALAAWAAHCDREGGRNSGEIVTALAYMLVIEDPDGRRIRLYTRETHGPEIAGEKDNSWMSGKEV